MASPFTLVLHTHLPMVVNHGRWPHGSDWLCEAAFECYLPLLETAHRLVADGISPKWTINLSPILTEQLASPEFQKELSFYYENVRRACVESREHFDRGGNKEIVRLTFFWEEFYERMWEMHRRIGGDIPGTFAAHGRESFVAGSPLASAGPPVFPYRDFVPVKAPRDEPASSVPGTKAHSPYAPYRVASRGGAGTAVAFIRDPRTTLQVWSREHGYPGEYAYLEFHKKHFPGGLRFWRITDNSGDLGRKLEYDPALAVQKVGLQARHFVELVTATLAAAAAEGPALVCSPYDAELFGHWWFEGPLWLEQVAREMARGAAVTPATLGEALAAVEPRATLALPEGSWGEGGDHRVWLNRDTEWTWGRVYSAEAEWAAHLAATRAAKGDLARALTQATRELLLLQASDWQFLITTGTARDYAERRVAEHYAEFKRLSEMARGLASGEPLSPDDANSLRRLEREDFCFPDLQPAWGMGPPGEG